MTSIAAIRAQLQPIPLPTQSFAGQTIIVTGSNTGLGFEAALHFVRLNAARVILAVRTVKKGEDAKASIETSTNRKNVVEVWQVDMSDYDSIKAFAKRCDSLDRLDVVVANAGVLKNTYEESEGTEITIKVNVIGTFLLAINLFPVLRRSGEKVGQASRIVITTSVLHEDVCFSRLSVWSFQTLIIDQQAKFLERKEPSIFQAFNKDKKSYIGDRYKTSKLLEVLLVRSLAAAIRKGPHATEPLIINDVNPGLCHSELDKDVQVITAALDF